MTGPCMCGDTQCPSCGPAQGNWKCPICNEWADNGCEHIGEDGNLLPEFEAEARRIAEAEYKAEQAYAYDVIMGHGVEPRDWCSEHSQRASTCGLCIVRAINTE